MLLLVIASIWAWAVIIDKLVNLSQLRKRMAVFEATFWSGAVLDQLYESVKRAINNPLAAVFIAAMNECKRQNSKNLNDTLKISHKERIIQSMYLVKNREMERLEQNLGFLATTASSAPFIGLFGTVWGIMHSFQSIAASKNTSLAVVAPGIAEALLATAIGLFAAIPAVIFYNYLSTQITKVHNKMDDFISELNSILSRAIDEERITRNNLASEINVTPLVDVMLVLLIIFMITSPMLVSGINVDLPETTSSPLSGQDEPLVVSINNKGELYLLETKISRKHLASKLSDILKEKKGARIFIRGDKNVSYGEVVEVVAEIHAAGFSKVALVSNIKSNEK
ncbi:Tol-Pal system protein TolQ, partial [Pseudolycoriella hygida]